MGQKKEYELDMNLSLEGLKMQGVPPEEADGPSIFFNTCFMVIKGYSDKTGGFDGHQHRIIYNIRNQMEQAVKAKDGKVVLNDAEIRLLNKIFYEAVTRIETNEIRQRIHTKILDAISDEGQEAS